MRLDTALWRALAVYRVAALLYAAALFGATAVREPETYQRPLLGVAVLSAMTGWTAAAAWLYADPRRRRWPLLAADLVLTVVALLASVLVIEPELVRGGAPTLTVSWAAAPVIAWAVWGGGTTGGAAGAAVGAAAVVERGSAPSQTTVNSVVLLLLLGVVVGYVVQLARRAETAYAEAVQLQAAAAERERLARHVHDGVLQALALVARRSPDPTLAALAGEQEQALRRLVSGAAQPVPAGTSDLRALLPAGPGVEVAAPAEPVLLRADVAGELAAAVTAAVDNAHRHGGAHAWLLVEDEPAAVTVTVRDDGPGIAPGRLEQAARDGRLGVAASIRGRVADLGGTVDVHSTPGQGTEVELRVPR